MTQKLAFLALLAGTALGTELGARRAGASSVIAIGLAIAALRAGPRPGPAGFMAVTGALLVVGVALAVIAAFRAWRARAGGSGAILGPAALVVGAAGAAGGSAGVVGAAPTAALVISIGVVAGVGLLLSIIGRWARVPEEPAADMATIGRVSPAVGLFLGIAVAGLGPHLSLVVIGVITAAWSAYFLGRAEGRAGVPWGPVLTLPLLGAWWLMATIAGPEGLGIAALPELPLSPAAERTLAPAFLLAGWATAGLWPLHRQTGTGLLASAGAILFVRIATPTLPDGVEHWRALAMPLVVLGIWHAAWVGRATGLAVGMAWIGLLGQTPGGRLGAALLLGVALATELLRRSGRSTLPVLARVALVMIAGFGGLLATEAGLHAEVVYTVLAVAGVAAAASRDPRHAMTASDPSTTEASA